MLEQGIEMLKRHLFCICLHQFNDHGDSYCSDKEINKWMNKIKINKNYKQSLFNNYEIHNKLNWVFLLPTLKEMNDWIRNCKYI